MGNSLLAVGSIAFDSVKTPHGVAEKSLGGSANYFSIAAALFNPVRLVGVVGEDFPPLHLEALAKRKIDLSGLQTAPGKTFHWSGEYKDDLNEAITHETHLNVFEHFDPTLPDSYRESEYIFLGNIDPVLQQHVLDQVKNPKVVALDSMNFWITGKLDELKKTLQRVDLITINEGEALLLSNKTNLRMAAEEILTMGPKVVVIKQGSYGSILFSHKSIFSAPALPLAHVVDPTGAGDTFAGGLMGYLAKMGASLSDDLHFRKGMIYGSVVASYNIEDFSFKKLLNLTEEDIEKRFKEVIDLTRFI